MDGVRLIGVIEAKQTGEKKKLVRNDRLIGVATESRRHEGIRNMHDVPVETDQRDRVLFC